MFAHAGVLFSGVALLVPGGEMSVVPSTPSPLENALSLHRAGRLQAAAEAYRAVLREQPEQADAHNLLGAILQSGGDVEGAEKHFARAAAASPRTAQFLLNHGNALRALGRHGEALDRYERALLLEPGFAEAHHQLGNALKSLHRYAESAASLRRAAALAPRDATVRLNLGGVLLETGARDEALQNLRQAVVLEPARPEARNILGSALLDAGRLSEARQQLQEALRLRPVYPAAHDNLGRALRAEGRAAEAVVEFRQALSQSPRPGTHSNLLYALNFVPGLSSEEIFAEHRRWAATYAAGGKVAAANFGNARDPARRLRIGYVSPDFVHHAVAYFFEPVLEAHDRSVVEVYCYSNVTAPDQVTERFHSLSDHWRDISSLGDDQAAELIRQDEIDVLVDLAGHTARNRLLVLARRPAPIQATWLGYPNTTGMEAVDVRITDSVSDPEGVTDWYYSEKLVRLPQGFSCYRPPVEAPSVGGLPALENAGLTFGSFNHFAKINAGVLELWARLLARLPGSRLLLKARSVADPSTAERVLAAFSRCGVAEDRITLCSDELSVAAHLALYQRVDVALDTFPYNGTTTTCEALWMGVPVVTLEGATHVSRVSASLLGSLGRGEWIAHSENEYLEIACRLASDLKALSAIRAGQRERMRNSPLCSAATFTRQLEAAYRGLWRAWCTSNEAGAGGAEPR